MAKAVLVTLMVAPVKLSYQVPVAGKVITGVLLITSKLPTTTTSADGSINSRVLTAPVRL